jgi:hypothetical protein
LTPGGCFTDPGKKAAGSSGKNVQRDSPQSVWIALAGGNGSAHSC